MTFESTIGMAKSTRLDSKLLEFIYNTVMIWLYIRKERNQKNNNVLKKHFIIFVRKFVIYKLCTSSILTTNKLQTLNSSFIHQTDLRLWQRNNTHYITKFTDNLLRKMVITKGGPFLRSFVFCTYFREENGWVVW